MCLWFWLAWNDKEESWNPGWMPAWPWMLGRRDEMFMKWKVAAKWSKARAKVSQIYVTRIWIEILEIVSNFILIPLWTFYCHKGNCLESFSCSMTILWSLTGKEKLIIFFSHTWKFDQSLWRISISNLTKVTPVSLHFFEWWVWLKMQTELEIIVLFIFN